MQQESIIIILMLLSLAGTSTTLGLQVHACRSLSSAASSSVLPSVLFDLDVPEGRCLALQFPNVHPDHPSSFTQVHLNDQHWLRDELHPLEIEYGLAKPPSSQKSFWMGRLAMHRLLRQRESCILKDAYGRPLMPTGLYGSISHKESTAVALISETASVGVDLETSRRERSIARKVLTRHEISDLGKVKGVTDAEEVLLRFSLKEAAYKAIHPIVCQYVGFQEAEIKPLGDGTAEILLNFHSGENNRIGKLTAHWRQIGDLFLSTASAEASQTHASQRYS